MSEINFAKTIKMLRNRKNLTQTDLANLLGVTKSAISAYENGDRQPSHDAIVKMANYFNVTIDYIYGERKMPGGAFLDVTYVSEANRLILLQLIRALENVDAGMLPKEKAEYDKFKKDRVTMKEAQRRMDEMAELETLDKIKKDPES